MITTSFKDNEIVLLALSGCFALVSLILNTRKKEIAALAFLVLAAFVIRVLMTFIDPYLNLWDEQYHAMVAKNMMDFPFKPMLYKDPVLPYDYKYWIGNHIWVHKQPVFLWMIAFSLKAFGVSAFAVRIPTLLATTLMVLIIYRIAELTTNKKIAYYSAFIYAFTSLFVELVTGYFHTDHNDTLFMFFVAATFWSFTEYIYSKAFKWVIIIGVIVGLAVMVKWLSAFLVFGAWGLYILMETKSINWKAYQHLLYSFVISCIVFLPWQLYIHHSFPVEAAYEMKYNAMHITTALEGHRGSVWYHLEQLSFIYGIACWLFIPGIFLFSKFSNNKKLAVVFFVSVLVVYIFFTIVQTKMPLLTLFVSFMFFIWLGSLFYFLENWLNNRLKNCSAIIVGLVLLLFSYLQLDISDTIEQRHTGRNPNNYYRSGRIESVNYCKDLSKKMNLSGYILFNCKNYDEMLFMFYTPVNGVYSILPLENELLKVKNMGRKIAVLNDGKLPDFIVNDKSILLLNGYYENK